MAAGFTARAGLDPDYARLSGETDETYVDRCIRLLIRDTVFAGERLVFERQKAAERPARPNLGDLGL